MDENKFKELSILIVDDDPLTRELIVNMLKDAPYVTLHQASNGEEALALLTLNHYDMLLLDLYMPKMNGEALLKNLKNSTTIECYSRVVLMTTDRLSTRELQDIGVDYCLNKPFDFHTFEKKIYSFVNKESISR